ncbi:MAG: conjugal transfer protein TraR [Halobacteriovorax sp.]|nr:conjugal transfer protein TraR [Halobacteriovorax sp.]|tara:strand:+ start:3327 stop:3710 length:384 start_codon:yes stop_codon:yes gene_type:complete
MKNNEEQLSPENLEELTLLLKTQKQLALNSIKEHNRFTLELNHLSDLTDIASAEKEQDENNRFVNRETRYLEKIIRSLHRISNGEYGICEDCSCEIPYKRLLATPTTELCRDCQEEQELAKKNSKQA